MFQQHDIAILELAKPVRFTDQVHTICLAENEPASTVTNATVAGWGSTEAFGITFFKNFKFWLNWLYCCIYPGTTFFPQLLLPATVPLMKLPQCKLALMGMGKLLNEQSVCAGGTMKDACQVDLLNLSTVARFWLNMKGQIVFSRVTAVDPWWWQKILSIHAPAGTIRSG